MHYAIGNSYDGEWDNDKKSEKGIFIWVDGEKY